MARTYSRDSRGRFASGGGGGGGKKAGGKKAGGRKSKYQGADLAALGVTGGKAIKSSGQRAATRYENKSRAGELRKKGTTGLGGRVKAKGFQGGKGAQQRAGGLRRSVGSLRGKGVAFTVGKGGKQSAAQRGATKASTRKMKVAASRKGQAGKPLARTNKSPVSAAKARYKELSGEARRGRGMLGFVSSAAENRKSAGARRSLKSMIAKRGRK